MVGGDSVTDEKVSRELGAEKEVGEATKNFLYVFLSLAFFSASTDAHTFINLAHRNKNNTQTEICILTHKFNAIFNALNENFVHSHTIFFQLA